MRSGRRRGQHPTGDQQLKPGSTLVIPVGGAPQRLMVLGKDAQGRIWTRALPVVFVPSRHRGRLIVGLILVQSK
jgi:protein-L-isoaspartate O-methyltransferase